MKKALLLPFILFLFACGKDETSFPERYLFSHVQRGPNALYEMTSPSTYQVVNPIVGSFKTNLDSTESFIVEFIQSFFDVKEVTLVSENMIHLIIQLEEELLDTTVTYTLEDKEIVIAALEDSKLLQFNPNTSEFEVCVLTEFAIPGPNAIFPNTAYSFSSHECSLGDELTDYADVFIAQNNLESMDTVGVMITKLIYTKQ